MPATASADSTDAVSPAGTSAPNANATGPGSAAPSSTTTSSSAARTRSQPSSPNPTTAHESAVPKVVSRAPAAVRRDAHIAVAPFAV